MEGEIVRLRSCVLWVCRLWRWVCAASIPQEHTWAWWLRRIYAKNQLPKLAWKIKNIFAIFENFQSIVADFFAATMFSSILKVKDLVYPFNFLLPLVNFLLRPRYRESLQRFTHTHTHTHSAIMCESLSVFYITLKRVIYILCQFHPRQTSPLTTARS